MQQMLNAAIKLAAIHHDGQFDKSGMPYILHPLRVFSYLKSEDEELNCIAILHDIVEDCAVSFSDLYNAGMTKRIVDGVAALTKMPGDDANDYLEGILDNPDAIKVKMADLRHNMDVRRLKGVTDKDMARLAKYSKMYTTLKESING